MENSSENRDGTGLMAIQTETISLALEALWTHFPKATGSCLCFLEEGFNRSPLGIILLEFPYEKD